MSRSRSCETTCSLIMPAPRTRAVRSLQFAEDALGEFDSSGRDGHGASAEFGFGADAFADFERALEKAIEYRAGGTVFVSDAIGFANLAEDFGFAEHHGIETGSDAKQMANGVAIVVVIERGREQIELHGMKAAKIIGKRGGGFVRGFRRNAVNFAAIAGGEDQRFVQNAAGAKFFGGLAGLFGGERHPFAHLDGRRAVIQSDEHNLHGGVLTPALLP